MLGLVELLYVRGRYLEVLEDVLHWGPAWVLRGLSGDSCCHPAWLLLRDDSGERRAQPDVLSPDRPREPRFACC